MRICPPWKLAGPTVRERVTPDSFQQMAGLVCYYSTRLYHYLFMSTDEEAGTCLYVQTADEGEVSYPMGETFVTLDGADQVYLKARLEYQKLLFSSSLDGEAWQPVGGELDASILSDDYGDDWGFTGAFVGLACQDLTGRRHRLAIYRDSRRRPFPGDAGCHPLQARSRALR